LNSANLQPGGPLAMHIDGKQAPFIKKTGKIPTALIEYAITADKAYLEIPRL
jgi:hypothetical protein